MEIWLAEKERTLERLFFVFVFMALFGWMIIQPLGGGPDEKMRYSIVQYIFIHWQLPHGGDPEILDRTWGFSYAFQPILPYMISAVFVKLGSFFTWNGDILVLFARFINIIFGVLMAVVTRKMSRKLFHSQTGSWLFTLLVVLLPQGMFMHTYVNTDSMALFSTVLIAYSWIRGMEDKWSRKSCILLSIGIILCAMSYYNAYGFILASMVLFFFYYVHAEDKKQTKSIIKWAKIYGTITAVVLNMLVFTYDIRGGIILACILIAAFVLDRLLFTTIRIDWNSLLRKGIFISVIVLIGIGWWFARSYILYDGDFLGLRIRDEYAEIYAVDALKPSIHETYYNQGHSIMYMLQNSNFIVLTAKSFIAMFGNMEVGVYDWIYQGYLILILAGLAGMCIPEKNRSYLTMLKDREVRLLNICMVICAVIPNALNIWAAYSYDYQPQGRYSLPMLAALMYLVSVGIHKLLKCLLPNKKFRQYTELGICIWIVAVCLVCLRMFVIPMFL